MKKIIIILATVMAMIACEGPMGPEGPMGQDGEPGYGTSWHTTSFTINYDEWELIGEPNGLNSYFFAERYLDELTNVVYKEGTVIAYIETKDITTSKTAKNGLPYVLHKGDSDEYGEFLWTQTYDFDFKPGKMGFYVSYSDFSTKIRPDTETFHIILMW